MQPKHPKPIFTFFGFLCTLLRVVIRWPRFLLVLIKPATPRGFREELMLASTYINRCRYCQWLHTTLALKHERDVDALQQFFITRDDTLLSNLPSDKADEPPRAVALNYVLDFASNDMQPSTTITQQLHNTYSYWQRSEIVYYAHAIYLSNVGGNTFDALQRRLKGSPVKGSKLGTELLVSIIGIRILLPILILGRRDKKVRFEGLDMQNEKL